MNKEPSATPTPTAAADAAAPTYLSDGTVIDKSVLKRLAVQFGLTLADAQAQPDERAAFEAWAMGEFELAGLPARAGLGYKLTGVDDSWAGWQAAWKARATAPQATVKGDERADALQDMAFVHGLQAGYQFGLLEDHARYEKCIASSDGYLKVLRETRSAAQPTYREAGVWAPDGSKFMTYRPENLNGRAMYVLDGHSARAAAPQAGATLTEEVIVEAVKKWFPDRSYQASFFARALLSPQAEK